MLVIHFPYYKICLTSVSRENKNFEMNKKQKNPQKFSYFYFSRIQFRSQTNILKCIEKG